VVAKGTNQNTLALDSAQSFGYGVGAAVVAAILVGLAGGLLQGLAITKLGVPAFVVTLGGMTIFRGMTLILSNGGPISTFDETYRFWGQGKIGDVPVPVILFLLFALLAHIILRYTRYGRHIYAIGGNPEAARLSGLNVVLLTVSVYVIVGFFAGLGGFVLSSRLNSSEAVAGTGYELTVIASVVIGGTSLFGGEGQVVGTVIGSLLIGVLINGLVLMNVSSYVQQIIIGVIIVLAVWFDRFVKARRRV
jgi:inositol transport system permease protein